MHKDYRSQGIGKKLCRTAWGVNNYFACGLVSSHPYAVRALEKATQRIADRSAIQRYFKELVLHSHIPYVQDCDLDFDSGKCLITTR